jgi:hypothetical protein
MNPSELAKINPLAVFTSVQDSTKPGHYSCGGSYSDAKNIYQWRGEGTLKPPGLGLQTEGVVYINGAIDLTDPALPVRLAVSLTAYPNLTITSKEDGTKYTLPDVISTTNLASSLDIFQSKLFWYDPSNQEQELPDFDIPAPKKPIKESFIMGDIGVFTGELNWKSMKAEFPPTVETPA